MKKTVVLFMVFAMAFSLCSCKNKNIYEPKISIPFSEDSILEFMMQFLSSEQGTVGTDIDMELVKLNESDDYYDYGNEYVGIDFDDPDVGTHGFVNLLCKEENESRGELTIYFFENTYDLSHEVYKIEILTYDDDGMKYVADIALMLMDFLNKDDSVMLHVTMDGEAYDWQQYKCIGEYLDTYAYFRIIDESYK